jgi:branched-chain amino acid aminotransferase
MTGKLSETPGANLMLVRDEIIITPGVTSDILEGITRESILQFAREDLGYQVQERMVDRTELYVADKVFICGTMFELQPVVSMDNIKVGDGEVGEVTGKIRSYYLDVVSGKVPKHNDWLTSV